MMSDELLPCPFCGQQPEMEPWHGGAPTKVMIACVGLHPEEGFIDCGPAPCVTGETPEEAIAAWNTRHPQQGRR